MMDRSVKVLSVNWFLQKVPCAKIENSRPKLLVGVPGKDDNFRFAARTGRMVQHRFPAAARNIGLTQDHMEVTGGQNGTGLIHRSRGSATPRRVTDQVREQD